jgi:glycosyltransferase involved in cell wall biosynthesis
MKSNSSKVFLHAWTGSVESATRLAQARYPGAEITELPHRQLREAGWRGQIRTFRRVKGAALIFYFRTLEDVKEPELLLWIQVLHGCRETVIADERGQIKVFTTWDCIRQIPNLMLAMESDLTAFSGAWLRLKNLLRAVRGTPVQKPVNGDLDLLYIYPFPLNRDFNGGAMSHFQGFLQGASETGATCEVVSGCELPVTLPFPVKELRHPGRRFIFSESLLLAYNWYFAREAVKQLQGKKPRAVYQRHGRFTVAGVLLARSLGVPFILEYNGSEVWIASHWDPARFTPWLRLAEEISLHAASAIIVVSDVLKQEVMERGFPAERIHVNPNGVDPNQFRPGVACRNKLRHELGFGPRDIVAAFLGSFSYWHGVDVLQEAILKLLQEASAGHAEGSDSVKLRFLLIGKGPLLPNIRAALAEYEAQGLVVFAGMVPHEDVPSYLDVADILVSPHVPMPDGKPFIGSPTKLFEYMAMGKAIVASRLDQLEKVLTHEETALLVSPGDAQELAAGVSRAARDEELRTKLGVAARAAAIAKYTWKRNAEDTLAAAGLR